MLLVGETLGARQKHLNLQVNEAALNNVPFQEVKDKPEKNDVDKLFKIDLAAKYRNVDYIVEVLKCGDSLYISRALKCTFLYDDEFAHIINPENLHNNVFPSMSRKMKNKLLSTIAMNVRNEERAKAFYQYCINKNMLKFVPKFLIFTSIDFKIDILQKSRDNFMSIFVEDEDIELFIGNNVTLANLYLIASPDHVRHHALYLLRYFYSIDADLYLNWVETKGNNINIRLKPVGLRMSKDIVKNHKDRIMKHIHLYVNLLNQRTFSKYTSEGEARTYLKDLLPEKPEQFWAVDFCKKYGFLLDLLPLEKRYNFVTSIFSEKYRNEPFEMSSHFNRLKYFNLMTYKQKEAWALRIMDSQPEPDYEYYRFLSYDKAFVEIRKLIYITPNADKRSWMINILVESARNESDIENLLKYYYERHVNENRYNKDSFLNKVTNNHNVFEFTESCWNAFETILHSLDIYNPDTYYQNMPYLRISLVYYIVNDKELPERLKKYANSEEFNNCWFISLKADIKNKLNEEKTDVVYRYIQDILVDNLKELEGNKYHASVKDRAAEIIRIYNEIKAIRKLPHDEPEIVTMFKLLLHDDEEYKENLHLNEKDLLHFLKQDASLVMRNLEKIKYNISKTYYDFKPAVFLKKLRIYFPDDLAVEYFRFLTTLLADACERSNDIKPAVFGIFHLADETYKSEFMARHAPANGKIDHTNIDTKLLSTQEAICRFAGYSRPPVPLAEILKYIKGDYLHHCLPIFKMYLANLPLPQFFKFVETLLDTAVSVQKHALRLAFHCFNTADLKVLINKVWKTSKNITLRSVIYTRLFQDIETNHNDIARQAEMFELLLTLTLDINKDEHQDIMNILTSYHRIPETATLRGRYLETAWKTVSKFPNEGAINLERRTLVLRNLKSNVELIDKQMIREIIDEYFHTVLTKDYISQTLTEVMCEGQDNSRHLFSDLNQAKFELAVIFITKLCDEEDYGVKYVDFVLNKCLELWNEKHGDTYIFRDYCERFINNITDLHFASGKPRIAINVMFENMLKLLQEALQSHEVYMITWGLRLTIMTNIILDHYLKHREGRCPRDLEKEIAKKYATEVNVIVAEYVEKKMFYWSMLDEIAGEIKLKLLKMVDAIESYGYHYLHRRNVEILTVLELSTINPNVAETAILSVKLMPLPCHRLSQFVKMEELLADIYKNLQKFGNPEVQTFLYKEFVRNGFKYNKYI